MKLQYILAMIYTQTIMNMMAAAGIHLFMEWDGTVITLGMIHGIMVDGVTHIITVAGTTHGGTHPGIGIVHGITDGITADFMTHGITAMVMAVGTVVVITGDSTLDITLL